MRLVHPTLIAHWQVPYRSDSGIGFVSRFLSHVCGYSADGIIINFILTLMNYVYNCVITITDMQPPLISVQISICHKSSYFIFMIHTFLFWKFLKNNYRFMSNKRFNKYQWFWIIYKSLPKKKLYLCHWN